jgi:dTDP-4-amino-4,6-dideoxygalactose transaminase
VEELIQERQAKLQEIEAARQRLEEIEDQIFEQIKDRVKSQGSTTVNENGHKIVVTIPMRTSWDETKLRTIAESIKQHGDDPEQYITFKPQVSEKAYKAWPEQIRKVFEPAREIKPGKRKLEVK